jgi:hypothetical protein
LIRDREREREKGEGGDKRATEDVTVEEES